MSELQDFPMLSQLSDIHEKNAAFDCVPTSLAAALSYLTGKPYDGGAIKDAVYGVGYTGATAAIEYVAYCKAQGVVLASMSGLDPAAMTAQAHAQLALGRPVVFTEVDPYVPASYGWTHVCVWYADNGDELTALDPYIGKPVTKTDQEWQAVLRENQLWILYLEEDVTITIQTPIIAAHFVQRDANHWEVKGKTDAAGNPIILHDGMLSWYCTNGYKPYCGYSVAGLPTSNEIPIELINPPLFAHLAGKGIVVVYFERGAWVYDIHNTFGAPEGSGSVYPLKLYEAGSPGVDPRLWTANLSKLVQSVK